MKNHIFLCVLSALLLGPIARSHAQSFSAELVTHSTKGTTRAKLYSSNGRVRLQAPAEQRDKAPSPPVTLWWVNEKMWIFAGQAKPDYDTVIINSLKLTYFIFRASDAGDLCGQYITQTEARTKARHPDDIPTEKLVCRDGGAETLGGRDTHKIVIGSSANGEPPEAEITLWISPQLHSVVKMLKNESGFSMQLENIHEAPQPNELFQTPAGASRID